MQKHLFICRHAETFDPAAGQEDFDRELTPHGEEQARQSGDWIRQQQVSIQCLLASSAIRTKATANFIVGQLGYLPDRVLFDERLFRAKEHEVVNILSQLDNMYNHVLLVGHNPTMSSLATHLAGREVEYLSPSSVLHLQFDLESWEEIQYKEGEVAGEYRPA